MFAIRSPCKCPVCDYISTRHWNVKSHIKNKHWGRAEPVRLHGRREDAYREQYNTVGLENSKSEKSAYIDPDLLESQLFDRNDKEEIQLAKSFKEVIPQFLQFEKLLRSENLAEKRIQNVLGASVIDAVISPNPIGQMNKSVNVYSNNAIVIRMLSYVCAFLEMNIFSAKLELKKMRDSQVNPPPDE